MTADAVDRPVPFAVPAVLCLACGAVDAMAFLDTGIFAANMTGNTVLGAIAAARLDFPAARDHALAIVTFFAGALAGRLLLVAAGGRAWLPVAVEGILLAAVACLGPAHPAALLLLAPAMGVQATAFTRFRGASITTVVMTNTLARVAEAVHDALRRVAAPVTSPRQSPVLLSGTWACYAVGAAAGAIAHARLALPLVVPALAVLAVAGALWRCERRAAAAAG